MQRAKILLASGVLLSSLALSALAASTTVQPKQQVPLIIPTLLNVAEQQQCVTEAGQDFCAALRIQLETTGIPWLDHVLLAQLDLSGATDRQWPADVQAHLEILQQQAAAWLTENYADIKQVRASAEPYMVAYEHQDSLRFIAQRNHLASFKQFSYDYSGGAHGMYSTRYLVFDLNTHRQLLLADILQKSADVKLLEKLRTLYLEGYAEYAEHWLSDNLAEQAEALLTDNFVFNEQGLTFSYPPYGLAPYSAGELRLTLAYQQLADIIKPEYVLAN